MGWSPRRRCLELIKQICLSLRSYGFRSFGIFRAVIKCIDATVKLVLEAFSLLFYELITDCGHVTVQIIELQIVVCSLSESF